MISYRPRLQRDSKGHATPVNQLDSIRASDLITVDFPRLTSEMPMENAMGEMAKHTINGAPVTDREGRLVGYLSDRDCLRLAQESRYNNSEAGSVKQYMNRQVKVVASDTNMKDLVEIFTEEWIPSYPVTESGKLVGVITRKSVLKAFAETRTTTW